jgi:hypothetical protein
MAIIKKTTKKKLLFTTGGNINYSSHYSSVWRFLKRLKIELPYYPAIPLLPIFLKESKLAYNRDTCTIMFIAVLFTLGKLWNQPTCSLSNEWIKKIWYIEYYSTTEKNEIISFARKCMELEIMILSKISQTQKDKISRFLSNAESRFFF